MVQPPDLPKRHSLGLPIYFVTGKTPFPRARISPACRSRAASWSIPARDATCVKWSKRVCPSFRGAEDSPGKMSTLTLTLNFAASSSTRFLSSSLVVVNISPPGMVKTKLYADQHNLFLHDRVLNSCRPNAQKATLVDASC